jgi:hypothetical protein
MTTATILSWVLAAAPVHPSDTDVPIAYAAPGPTILEAVADETVEPDGRRVRWASVTYELPSGRQAEAFVEVDDSGRADALIYSDGEPLVHVTTDGQGNDTTWVAPDIGLPPEDFSQLLVDPVVREVIVGIGNDPLAGASACKWAKAAKLALAVAGTVSAGVCCAYVGGPTLGTGCLVCDGLAAATVFGGSDVIDDYCS